jgi:hypothetical protein
MMQPMAKSKLSPLPLGEVGSTKPTGGAEGGAPAADSSIEEKAPDTVDKWLADHPEGLDEDAVPQETEEKPEEKPGSEAPPASPTPPVEPGVVEKTPVPPGEAKPAAPADQVPAVRTYDPGEKFALGEGAEWTREQLVSALRERVELQKTAPAAKAESEELKKIFGVQSVEQARENWAPLLERLSREPNVTSFIDGYLSNPAKAQYLDQCSAAFDQYVVENPQGVAATNQGVSRAQQTAAEAEMAKQLKELNEWKVAQEKRATDERVAREWAQVTAKYPFIANDVALRQDLFATAQWMNAQDPSKGLLDALALKSSLLDQISTLRNPQQVAQQPAPQVPALLGSSGASPTATRRNGSTSSDPVDRWLANPESRKFSAS